MGSSVHLEVILGIKETFFFSFFFPLQLEGLCYQRVVPQGLKQQGRKAKDYG